MSQRTHTLVAPCWPALVIIASLAVPPARRAAAGEIDPGLLQVLARATAAEQVSVLVFLRERVDLEALTARMDVRRARLAERHRAVVRALRQKARATQGGLLRRLEALRAEGRVATVRPFWISNCVRLDATRGVIREVAARPDVQRVYLNYPIELVGPAASGAPDRGPRSGPEPGLIAVRAPEVWALGLDGKGVLVANIDTGVDGNHPALASRWAGAADSRYEGHPEWAWYDPYSGYPFPRDLNGHGTHTMGTACGGAPGDEIGVAPGAYWIAAAPIDRGGGVERTVADAILSFQWLVDPDGDPATNWDVPAVCSNSWGLATWHGYPPCDELFWSYLDACEAAGIVILFSAGNEGPAPNTLRRPADRATDEYRTCAVAAVDARDATPPYPIASFSSRGPSYCTGDGSPAIKPDISGPGVDVRSSIPGGGYAYYSGTSMASPHVNGVVALMRQACPDLGPREVIQILYDTALDQGAAGEDNDYGYGMVDAYEAVLRAQGMCVGVWIRFPNGLPEIIPPGEPTFIDVQIVATNDDYIEGSGTFYYRFSPQQEFHSAPLMPVGAELYRARLPAPHCGDTPEFYFSAEGADSGIVYMPPGAPDESYSAKVAVPEFVSVYVEALDSDPGWSTQDLWAFGQPTGRGGEYGGPDPASGHSGPNVYGYNLDGDYQNHLPERHLTSGPFDCTGLINTHLRFWRWLGVEQPAYDHAYVRVSSDGAAWTTVWQNGAQVSDYSWTPMDLDISRVADDQPAVYLRWTMGTTDASWRFCGWNIDDVEIVAYTCQQCAEDLNGDRVIDQADLGILLADWGCAGADCAGDIDGDGDTDQADLGLLLARYGQECP